MDVSPQYNHYPKILFLPDPTALYDPLGFRPNQVAADGDDPRSIEVVTLLRERYAALDACRARGARGLDWQSQFKSDQLLQRIADILRELG